ncbi:MAG: hypothetical protein JNG90_07820 [Planctomycetaceae bacterium]|nr:hypothetical protein [Planctomycetaceae bacterium]
MNDRTRAIEVLKQAREVLLTRLAERVLDSREDILDDAGGYSYCGAIEGMHDQLGQRLANVAAMLAHLQSGEEQPTAYEPVTSDVLSSGTEVDAVFGIGLEPVEDQAAECLENSGTTRDSFRDSRSVNTTSVWHGSGLAEGKLSEAGGAPGDIYALEPEGVCAPRVDSDIAPSPPVVADSADAGCRDHVIHEAVFHEADFRSVDLLPAEFDPGSRSPTESGTGDIAAGE